MEDLLTTVVPDIAREGGVLLVMYMMLRNLTASHAKYIDKVEALEKLSADGSDELRLTLAEKQLDELKQSCGRDHDAFVEHKALVTSQLHGIWGKVGDRPTDRCNKTGG